jgi:hypothetical protein
MKALVMVPRDDRYPWREVDAGVRAAGLRPVVESGWDVLVTWSPWVRSPRERLAKQSRVVVVLENGWLTPIEGERYYQVQLNSWNRGRGARFVGGGPERWASWGVPLRPWRARLNAPYMVLGQTGHPYDNRSATPGWANEILDYYAPHGAFLRPKGSGTPLLEDIERAGAAVTWTSNAASWCLVHGLPVVAYSEALMTRELAIAPGEPWVPGDRESVFSALAWAQWNKEELASGEPFRRLLSAC